MSKRKIKFNFLDVLLILGVFALVAGIIWRQELTDKIQIRDSENTINVTCEFELISGEEDQSSYRRIQFEDGSTRIFMNGVVVGTVEKTTIHATPEASEDSGSTDDDSKEDEVTAAIEKLHLKLSAVSKDSGYYLAGDVKLYINGVYRFHTKNEEFSVRIGSIEE